MKRIIALASVLFSTVIFAIPPVILSTASPAIAPTYNDNTSNIITYTITNNVPKMLPLTVSGISNGIQRTTVPGDCGNTLPIGPSTCHIGINISPSSTQVGSTISQTLTIDYQGRAPLTRSISFLVETFAYVTPLSPDAFNTSKIQQYLLSQDGLLSFYKNATQTEEHYGQMTFATVNGTQYAYILENGVIYCSINSNGTFNNYTPTTAPTNGMNHPHGIAFATFNQQYAYLSDPSSSSLFQCTIDITNGNLLSCLEYADGNIDAALGIAFNTDGNGVQHAYVADAATGMVVCPMDATGSFMNPPGCAITPSLGAPVWFPYGIAFTTAGGTRYAYVVNKQNVNIGSIYRCSVDETTGLLTQDCIKTPDIPPDRDTWQPSGIAFR